MLLTEFVHKLVGFFFFLSVLCLAYDEISMRCMWLIDLEKPRLISTMVESRAAVSWKAAPPMYEVLITPWLNKYRLQQKTFYSRTFVSFSSIMCVLVERIEKALRRKGSCRKHTLEHMKRLGRAYHDWITGFMHS